MASQRFYSTQSCLSAVTGHRDIKIFSELQTCGLFLIALTWHRPACTASSTSKRNLLSVHHSFLQISDWIVNHTVICAEPLGGVLAITLSRAPHTDLVTGTGNYSSTWDKRVFLTIFGWRIVWSFTSYRVFSITLFIPEAQFLYQGHNLLIKTSLSQLMSGRAKFESDLILSMMINPMLASVKIKKSTTDCFYRLH